MAQLQFKNVNAPNLSGTASILKQASDQLTSALSGGSKVLADYTKGQQEKADGLLVSEIAKLSNEDDISNFLSSEAIQGKPLSPKMQEAVLGLRKNLLGLQADRANIEGTKTNTAVTRNKDNRAEVSAPLENALLKRRAEAIESNTSLDQARGAQLEANTAKTLRQTQSIDLEDQLTAANIQYKNAQTDEQRVIAATKLEQIQTDLARVRAGTANTNADTAGTLIENQFIAREKESGLLTDAVGRDNTRASTLLTGAKTQAENIDNQTRGTKNLADIGRTQALTSATNNGVNLANAQDSRTNIRFNNEQSDRVDRLSDEAEAKANKRTRAEVAYKYTTDPQYTDRDSMLRALAKDPAFVGLSPNEIVQTANQAVAQTGTPLGRAYNPNASLTLDEQAALTLGEKERITDVRAAEQTRLFDDTKLYVERPQNVLLNEFPNLKNYLRPDDLRKEINKVAREANVTPEQAAVSLRENHEGQGLGDYFQSYVSYVSPDSIFRTEDAIKHAKENFSPEASARNDRRKVAAETNTKKANKLAGELKKLRAEAAAVTARGGTPKASLIADIEAKRVEMLSINADPDIVVNTGPIQTTPIATPGSASDTINQVVGPFPSEPTAAAGSDVDQYLQQLLEEEARAQGVLE